MIESLTPPTKKLIPMKDKIYWSLIWKEKRRREAQLLASSEKKQYKKDKYNTKDKLYW